MVWDLRGALLKKGETESARLADFEFRLRVRTFRLLAAALGEEPDAVAALVARSDDAGVLTALAERHGEQLQERYAECRAEARRQLVAERGDPSPYRLL